jgi:glycine/D-amino acid oxidase-like deaminating enzyme
MATDQTDGIMDGRTAWMPSLHTPFHAPLTRSVEADVCVIGAGVSGLTTAYFLARTGRSVIVLDAGDVASGATAFTTAQLTTALDAGYVEIEKLHGTQGARLAAQSHTVAIAQIEAIVKSERIDCDFARVDGYLFARRGNSPTGLREERFAARRAGLRTITALKRNPRSLPSDLECLRFKDQAQVHPLKYAAGLAHSITRDGGRIFARTRADGVEGGRRPRVRAGEHVVDAGAVVVATNTPINDTFAVQAKQVACTSYVIAARLPSGLVEPALYWDTENPCHYARLHAMRDSNGPYDLLIAGGEDQKAGQKGDAETCHARLWDWASEMFPGLGPVEYRWAGEVLQTFDGLAFIGPDPSGARNVFVVTGDCGTGMTHGAIAGLLLRDLILGRDHPWAGLYDPDRGLPRSDGERPSTRDGRDAPYDPVGRAFRDSLSRDLE